MIWRTIRKSQRVRCCSRGGCEHAVIDIGDRYLSCVASPHHDDLGNTHWWRLVECESCAKRNGIWPTST